MSPSRIVKNDPFLHFGHSSPNASGSHIDLQNGHARFSGIIDPSVRAANAIEWMRQATTNARNLPC